VLDQIDFCADKGTVHALIGENGSGKSVLMKLVAGLITPDSGEIRIDGYPVVFQSSKQAQDHGVAMIYQEINLFPDLNVTENVFMSREPLKDWKWLRPIDWKRAYGETRKYLDDLGLDIDERRLVKTLSGGEQKFVEMIRALSMNAGILILDEPTAALTEQEIDKLFRVLRDIKKRGVTIIYISHRIEEVWKIADAVTVIQKGKAIHSGVIDSVRQNEIARLMAGRAVDDRYPKLAVKPGREVLRIENLECEGRIRGASLVVHKGEILALTGLSGSGRRTLAKLLFGIESPYKGTVYLNGKPFSRMTPHLARRNGLCYVTGNGTDEGLLGDASIAVNITLSNLGRIARAGFLKREAEIRHARDMMARLDIEGDGTEAARHLSGGAQKKVILAKGLYASAKLFVIEEPTAGIDIGSKIDIYNIMNELVRSGAAIIMISSDLPEVLGMSDRICVMYNGEIRKTFTREEATQEKVLYAALGGK